MNVEFRAVIHFCWLEKLSPKETFQKMRDTYCPISPEESTIYKWFEEFDKSSESIFDLPRCGRPELFEKVSDVKKVIDEFPFASCRFIAHIVCIDKKTVKRILIENLQMKKVLFRWVPKDLSQDQKNAKMEGSFHFYNHIHWLKE